MALVSFMGDLQQRNTIAVRPCYLRSVSGGLKSPMAKNAKHEAAIPNPALKPWSILVGEWETVGKHRLVPDTLHGHASFEWLEGGAFLMMYSEIDEPGVPTGIAIFGSDDATKEFFMLYFDERGVSRKYEAMLR